jgi:hypothetical protein
MDKTLLFANRANHVSSPDAPRRCNERIALLTVTICVTARVSPLVNQAFPVDSTGARDAICGLRTSAPREYLSLPGMHWSMQYA